MAWLDDNNSSGSRNARFGKRIADADEYLRSRDPVISDLIDRCGPCTLKPQNSFFPVMVETVISQQLSTAAAKSIFGRLVGVVKRRLPRPVDILGLPDKTLLDIGFSRSKVLYVKNVAEVFQSRRMGPKTFDGMTDGQIVELLTSIKGIGDWSAHMFLIFALGRLDVFPVGDLGLRNAMARAYNIRKPPPLKRLNSIGGKWRPYRTVGTWYMWESYDNG